MAGPQGKELFFAASLINFTYLISDCLKTFNFLLFSGKKHSWLGKATRAAENTSAYMTILSRGGLKMPSKRFVNYLERFETKFRIFHGLKVNEVHDPIKSFAKELLRDFPGFPWDILLLFSKTRFFIRLKTLNNDLKTSEKKFRRGYVRFISKFR